MNLRTPWRLAPLGLKYYGTRILDCNGKELFKIWEIPWGEPGAEPSEREEQEEICDSHYESVQSYEMASAIVESVNHDFA